jgi:hypothetical protein
VNRLPAISQEESFEHDVEEFGAMITDRMMDWIEKGLRRGEISFNDFELLPIAPHALRVRYADASEGYAQKEVVVYALGYDRNTATLFEILNRSSDVDNRLAAEEIGRCELARIYAHQVKA